MDPISPATNDLEEFEPHAAPHEDVTHLAYDGMDQMAVEPQAYDNVIPFYSMPQVPEEQRRLQKSMALLSRLATVDNVADLIEDGQLAKIGMRVVREYKIDLDSRKEWEQTAQRAMDMAKQKKEAKNTPWENSSNVKYPLLTTAALQFAARAYPAIVDGPRVVKCTVLGRDQDGIKASMADRVSQHMSYQLIHEVDNWESDVDTMLHQIPIVGCAFKKVYENQMSPAGFGDDLVSAFDFVINQKVKSLESAPRYTHRFTLYPHEIEERQRAGTFRDVELHGNGGDDGDDDDAPEMFLEQHRYLDIDEDGVREPWIVTVHEDSQTVVRIKPSFLMDDVVTDNMRGQIVKIPRLQHFVKIPFIPDPEGGFYDIGFGKLLESLSDVIDTTINQIMDAGTLQNAGGGFIAGTLQLKKSQIRIKPGEYQTVQANGNDLRNSIVNFEHPGPSQVLFTLLEMMIASGKDIAAVKDVLTGETPTNQTATSTMAAIEQGLKVFSAIYKRIFRAFKTEFKLIYGINKRTLQMPKYIALLDEPVQVVQQDYHDELDVMPVADPNTVTEMQRVAKAQFVMEQVAAGNPNIDGFAATKRALEAARIDNVKEVLVPPRPKPQDALMEAGARAEVAKNEAQAEQATAAAEKSRVDALVALATTGIPPQIVPQVFPFPFRDAPMALQPQQPQPMPPGPPMGPPAEMQGMPPPMMPDQGPVMAPDAGYVPQMPPGEGGQAPIPQ